MSTRRQNSSCDQCRRSKRKCVFALADPTALTQTCLYCTALGNNCTFAFVTARIEERRRKLARVGSGSHTSIAKKHNQVTTLFTTQNGEAELPNAGRSTAETQRSEFDFALGSDLSFDNLEERWEFVRPELTAVASSESNTQVNKRYTPGLWSGSPIQLLNSTVTASLWGDYLDDIYKSMMNGIESRYLAYTCNLYSPNGKYSFDEGDEEEDEEESAPLSNSPNTLAPLGRSSIPAPPRAKSRTITFVGLARFLDHFGHLYGNTLDKQTRKEDEETLIAVKSAFALQWLDCGESNAKTSPANATLVNDSSSQNLGDSNARFFATAWFNARSRILNASPHHSFTRVYNMFLFHITNPPEEAKDVSQELNDCLGRGLQEFLALKRAVEGCCELLSPTSTYRMLLESAIKIFHWFGYVRDTMASMVFDRECILPDAPLRPGLSSFTHMKGRSLISKQALVFHQFCHQK
jgi:hypothetical protein